MNVRLIFSIIEIRWPFPKRCFCLSCFRLLLFSMASMICSRRVYGCLLSSFVESPCRSRNIQCCPLVCHSFHLPTPLSLSVVKYLDNFSGFSLLYLPAIEKADLFNLCSCVTPRVKIIWCNRCVSPKSVWILTCNFLLWCCNLPASTFSAGQLLLFSQTWC